MSQVVDRDAATGTSTAPPEQLPAELGAGTDLLEATSPGGNGVLPDGDAADGGPVAGVGDDDTRGGETENVAVLRGSLAAGAAMLAVAVMLGGMFSGWQPRLFAAVGGVEGVALAAWTARSRGLLRAQTASALAILALAALATLTAGVDALGHVVPLMQQAAAEGHALRPPAPFDPGWRPLLVLLCAFLGYCAGWLATGMRRPQLGMLLPLPVLVFAAISQAPSDQVPDGIAAFALFAAGLAVLYRETGDGTGFSAGFELRRALRSAPMVLAVVIGLVLLTRADFLFPAPAYDPAQEAQAPHVVALSDVKDVPLFTVRSDITGPWRTGVLDVYDGNVWRLPPYAQSRLRPVPGSGVIDPLVRPAVRADFTAAHLDGIVLATPAQVGEITEQGDDLVYDDRTGTVRLATGQVRDGLSWTVSAAAAPTADELRDAQPDLRDAVDLRVPPMPDAVRRFLSKAPASGWARADWVRKQFLSTVTSTGEGTPEAVPPAKVADMLEGSRQGSPFDIVAGEALLERWAGIPARIGYGYDRGEKLADGSQQIRPRNGASWLELDLRGFGWIPVTGTPLHAKGSLGSHNVVNTDQQVLPSDDIAVTVFIPVDQVTPAPLYEVVRPYVLTVIAVLIVAAIAWVLWPALYKSWRRARRRGWAARTGRRARIACAYAEFRELATDLGGEHWNLTPLSFLEHVVEDQEHEELAWMVTRLLWGDLAGRATDADVHAAEEMSRSLRRRMSRAQPLSVRLLALVSRLSLKHPYDAGLEWRREREAA